MIKLRFKQDLRTYSPNSSTNARAKADNGLNINFLERLKEKSVSYKNSSDLIESYFVESGMCKETFNPSNNPGETDKSKKTNHKKDSTKDIDVDFPLCLRNIKAFAYSEELVVRSKS